MLARSRLERVLLAMRVFVVMSQAVGGAWRRGVICADLFERAVEVLSDQVSQNFECQVSAVEWDEMYAVPNRFWYLKWIEDFVF